ncbi:hypothetical protein F750_3946 [Streptomyces sp. PAMC 26508]|nr:hypothetical protein F750_3946 [Streptomyces sp. PAMC 26508]
MVGSSLRTKGATARLRHQIRPGTVGLSQSATLYDRSPVRRSPRTARGCDRDSVVITL